MSYKQLIPFDQARGGKEPTKCLKNTRLGFRIPPYFNSAWDAWTYTEQHTGLIPTGLDVPVYFRYWTTLDGVYANYGHIGVRLKDGRFWSDGRIYPNLQAYEQNHAPVYVGWGESINDVKVIKEGDDMITSVRYLDAMFQQFFMRNSTKSEQDKWIGKKTYDELIDTLQAQKAYKDTVLYQETGVVAVRDKWEKQIYNLQAENKELKKGYKEVGVIDGQKIFKEK